MTLRGLVAATFTPFRADGTVDYDRIPPMVDFVIRQGADGIYALGSTGEGPSLTTAERRSVAEALVRANNGRVPIVIQVGHASIAESRGLARHAAEIGADAFSATPPSYFKPENIEVLVDCMAEIASAAPELPFYYYNLPGVTGVRFDMVRFLAQAAAAISNLRGIKFSDLQVYEMSACVDFGSGRFDILFGADEMMLSGFVGGARGAVGSTYNFAGPIFQRVIAAFERGDLAAAAAEQRYAARMIDIILKCGGRGGLKAAMAIVGCDCGPSRLPLVTPGAKARASITSGLDEIKFFDSIGIPHVDPVARTATPDPAR